MREMRCLRCGKVLRTENIRCPHCGGRLVENTKENQNRAYLAERR